LREVAEIASRVLGTHITYQQASVDTFAESIGQPAMLFSKDTAEQSQLKRKKEFRWNEFACCADQRSAAMTVEDSSRRIARLHRG